MLIAKPDERKTPRSLQDPQRGMKGDAKGRWRVVFQVGAWGQLRVLADTVRTAQCRRVRQYSLQCTQDRTQMIQGTSTYV